MLHIHITSDTPYRSQQDAVRPAWTPMNDFEKFRSNFPPYHYAPHNRWQPCNEITSNCRTNFIALYTFWLLVECLVSYAVRVWRELQRKKFLERWQTICQRVVDFLDDCFILSAGTSAIKNRKIYNNVAIFTFATACATFSRVTSRWLTINFLRNW